MKKYHSVLFMLAMVMAACVFVSCSDDDDFESNDNIWGIPNVGKTLIIQDEAYYGTGSITPTYGDGIYFDVEAIENLNSPYNGKYLSIHLSEDEASTISKLYEGKTLEYIYVREYRDLNSIVLNNSWEILSGDVTVTEITDETVTININDLVIEHYERPGNTVTISGPAILEIQPAQKWPW